MRQTRAVLWLATLLAVTGAVLNARPQARCGRECLTGFLTQYLGALVAHDPGRLPLADTVRFTEDTVEKSVGEGLWRTASGLRPYRQDVVDVRQGVVGTHAVVEEDGRPVMLVVRLKVVESRITEIETMVVRNQSEGMIFDVEALTAPSEAMTRAPLPSQLDTREEAIRIATLYPAGLKTGSFVSVDVPFAPDAYRFENGRLMAGPGCTFLPGCEDIKGQRIPTLSQITHRVAAVDEDLGIVWLRMDFGPGSTRGANSLAVWEMFKVYSDQVHAVEAFMENMSLGAGSGWD